MIVRFQGEECTCDHDPGDHESGYGCTRDAQDSGICPCMAGWVIV